MTIEYINSLVRSALLRILSHTPRDCWLCAFVVISHHALQLMQYQNIKFPLKVGISPVKIVFGLQNLDDIKPPRDHYSSI